MSGEIYGFIGESIQPLGQISFPVTFSDGRHTRTEVLDLLVVPFTSAYDVLIGRDGQAQFHMATSAPHGAMGIPTETGVAIIYKNR